MTYACVNCVASPVCVCVSLCVCVYDSCARLRHASHVSIFTTKAYKCTRVRARVIDTVLLLTLTKVPLS